MVGERVVVEETAADGGAGCFCVWKTRILPARMPRTDSPGRNTTFRRDAQAASSPMSCRMRRRQHRRSVGDQFLDRVRRVVHVRPAIRPVLDDVAVVDFDVTRSTAPNSGIFEMRKSVKASIRAAGVGGTALGLEDVPVQRLLRRDHAGLVDL